MGDMGEDDYGPARRTHSTTHYSQPKMASPKLKIKTVKQDHGEAEDLNGDQLPYEEYVPSQSP